MSASLAGCKQGKSADNNPIPHSSLLIPHCYYASFIPGLQNIISKVISERLKDVKIVRLLDGAVIFETSVSYDKLNFFIFNNIFAVINVLNAESHLRCGTEDAEIFKDHARALLSGIIDFNNNVISSNNKKLKTFRIVFSNGNLPSAVDDRLRAEAERFITELSGLKADRYKSDTEFWFLFRKEKEGKDFSVFMKRLSLRPSWDKTLHKGELPPPLAWTMCRLANLKHGDTVLDPFCGYGSIPEAALKHFHIKKFIACDCDEKAAKFTKERFKNRKKESFVFYKDDFSNLPAFIGEGTIDAIVTDPPWGQFKELADCHFYGKMFEVFGKLLKGGGRALVLCANAGLLEEAPECIKLQESMPILLSGRKAAIYLFVKNSV